MDIFSDIFYFPAFVLSCKITMRSWIKTPFKSIFYVSLPNSYIDPIRTELYRETDRLAYILYNFFPLFYNLFPPIKMVTGTMQIAYCSDVRQ